MASVDARLPARLAMASSAAMIETTTAARRPKSSRFSATSSACSTCSRTSLVSTAPRAEAYPVSALDSQRMLDRLRAVIRDYESAITAFSAGVDSTLVALIAQQELGDRALAATAVSASLAPSELDDAVRLASVLGLRHQLVYTREVEDPRYATNPVDRCYFCKTHLYTELEGLARETGARYILNGLNVDDLGDWRPGAKAAAERQDHVRSPLHEAGMGKTEIRAAARLLGLPNSEKPALACL